MLRKIQNYKKKTNRQSVNVITIEKLLKYKRPLCICLGAFLLVTLSTTLFSIGINKITNDDDIEFAITQSSQAAVSSKRDVIQIPVGMVKKNPFVPYGNVNNSKVHDVPDFALIDPPEIVDEGSDGARVMDTIVSGILYDKFSPSAILNIEGSDYLVKQGDVVNNYKVLNIAKDSVTVKLGANVYRAGIGEILTEGSVNYNNVANLNNKFGGKK